MVRLIPFCVNSWNRVRKRRHTGLGSLEEQNQFKYVEIRWIGFLDQKLTGLHWLSAHWIAWGSSSCSKRLEASEQKGLRMQPRSKTESLEAPWRVAGMSLLKVEKAGVWCPQVLTGAKGALAQAEASLQAQAILLHVSLFIAPGKATVKAGLRWSMWPVISGNLCTVDTPRNVVYKSPTWASI